MKYTYYPKGTCSNEMIFEIEGDRVLSVEIVGGCPGNTLGVSRLCAGKKIEEIIELLQGIPCRNRGTSCPDQLAKALVSYQKEHATNS